MNLPNSQPVDGFEAIKGPPSSFARSHVRFEMEMGLDIQVLIPEETFQPMELTGHSVDLSQTGMQVHIPILAQELYNKLLMRPRYARVIFTDPFADGTIKLTGRIAWIDYRKEKASDKDGPCKIGIFFDNKEGIDLTEYSAFLKKIIKD